MLELYLNGPQELVLREVPAPGGVSGDQARIRIRSEVTIHGSIIYTLDDWAEAIGYVRDPRFTIRPILSKVVPLSEYQQAFADALSGDFAKIVLRF